MRSAEPHRARSLSLAELEATLGGRRPVEKVRPGLGRIRAALSELGNPHTDLAAIHVTGTNGKTSTSRFIDAILSRRALRTGRFTSPHLRAVTERITFNGVPIDRRDLLDAVHTVRQVLTRSGRPELFDQLTFFELLVATAYSEFARRHRDAVVIEVGLGGRWDATNVIDGRVCVFTPIDLDHQALLGDSITAIAKEKSGIVKPGSIVVSAHQPAEAMTVLDAAARQHDAPVLLERRDFHVTHRRDVPGGQVLSVRGAHATYEDIALPVLGAHQAQNAACAIAAAEAFVGRALDPAAVRASLGTAGSPGRLHPVRANPDVLIDASHNPHGLRTTLEALRTRIDLTRWVIVLAVLADKDVDSMANIAATTSATVIATTNTSPRAMAAKDLAAALSRAGDPHLIRCIGALDSAIAEGMMIASSYDGAGVLVTGSVVTAAEALALFECDADA